MIKFDITDNFINQLFTFPSFLIRYLMFNINSNGLKKLYQTCKYFYAKLQINIVDVLCIDIKDKLYDGPLGPYGIKLCPNQLDQLPNNLWLTEGFLLGCNLNISKLFSKIVRCNLVDLYLAIETKFTLNELQILTQSKTIKTFNIDRLIYLSHDNDVIAAVEDILPYFLCAHSISFDICHVTNKTLEKLLLLNFDQKFTRFSLFGIDEMLDANLMDKFLQKNLGNNASLSLNHVDELDDKIFNLQMFKKMRGWTPEEKKPCTLAHFFR